MTTAYAELIERLRAWERVNSDVYNGDPKTETLCREAADALAALTRELEEAREACAKIADAEAISHGALSEANGKTVRVARRIAAAIRAISLSRASAVRQADPGPLHEHDGEHDEH